MDTPRERLLDELLVLRCREGSREALQQLAGRWQERLWRHARRLTGHPDVAWDVLQEAWISIAGSLVRLDDPAGFGRWAYTIVSRRAADWHRRNGDAHPERLDDGPEPAAPPDEGRPVVEAVRGALGRLPGDQRAILALRYVDGFDVATVASVLGVPEGTAKSRLHTAREHLREIIERTEK